MKTPVTQLDDRSFDDLVAEARRRIAAGLPDVAPPAEGDPVNALVDLFAYLTEGVIYRANLVPERQRQLFLNLLQLPMRPARPAVGLVAIDAKPSGEELHVAPLLAPETVLRAGSETFTTEGEIAPLPVALKVLVKEAIANETLLEAGITPEQLLDQYGGLVTPFRPKSFAVGRDRPDASTSLDGYLYLLLHVPAARFAGERDALRGRLAGQTLNIGLSPLADIPGDVAEALPSRALTVEIAVQQAPDDDTVWLPLEEIDDTSAGGRRTGVLRLRLPRSADTLASEFSDDPRRAGYGSSPPEAPVDVGSGEIVLWLRLATSDGSAPELAYVDVNCVRVRGQGIARNAVVGAGNGRPGQTVALPFRNVDPEGLDLGVVEAGHYRSWRRVGHFAGTGPDERVFRLDLASGLVEFGDGVRGREPEPGAAILVRQARHGGGPAGNLAPNTLKRVEGDAALYAVRQPHPFRGGVAAETIREAEARIPAFLTHRARAVTKGDYETLARDNPLTAVARAEAVPGLVPGANVKAVRTDVPGAIAVFVMPPAVRALGSAPRPTVSVLRDVFHYLDARKTLAAELYVLSPEFVPVALSVAATASDPRAEATMRTAIVDTLLSYLWALPPGGEGSGWPMGRALDLNELRTVAGRAPAVRSVDGIALHHRSEGTWTLLSGSQLVLKPFQLPELAAVTVGPTLQVPPLVAGAAASAGPQPQPAPVAPDIC